MFKVIEGGGETTPAVGVLTVVPPNDEWLLADVDDLARFRTPDGESYDPTALKSVRQNTIADVQEGAQPHAVSEVEHEWLPSAEADRGGIIRDLGRTAVETATRGRDLFYRYPQTQARGDVEINYAAYNQAELRPGIVHVMIAPKMTRKDAPLKIAKAEGLAKTDSIQIDWLGLGEDGEAIVAKTATILVEGIGLPDWVAMLADKDNLLGKSISLDDPESALSLMKSFKELDLPLHKLPEGPVTILAAVIPYIQDPEAKQKVIEHLAEFRGDQAEMRRLAISSADRWVQYKIATDQSVRHGFVTPELQTFMDSLKANWHDKDREIIEEHKLTTETGAGYRMSRELAKLLHKAIRNIILTQAAVAVGNQEVLDQMSPEVARQIYEAEMAVSKAYAGEAHVAHIATTNNSLIASLNIKVGGGCCPIPETNFKGVLASIESLTYVGGQEMVDAAKVKELSWHGGKVKEGECTNCKEHTQVGVKDWCHPCISNPNRAKKVIELKSSTKNSSHSSAKPVAIAA